MNTLRTFCCWAGGVALLATAPAFAGTSLDNLKINGFLTAGVAVMDDDHGGAYLQNQPLKREGVTNDPNTHFDSVAGLQFDYAINPKTNAVVQIVAEGKQDFAARAEWAYVRYAVSDALTIRGGRFSWPGFLYSDSYLVGQAYPWARLPTEVYAGIPITSLQGFDALYRLPLGGWTLSGQLALGSTKEGDILTENGGALNLTLSNDTLTVRLGRLVGDLSTSFHSQAFTDAQVNALKQPGSCGPISCIAGAGDPFGRPDQSNLPAQYFNDRIADATNLKAAKASFDSFGVLYDDGAWFAAGEFTRLRIEGPSSDWDSGYLSLGHYFGKFLPYALWGKINSVKGGDKVIPVPGLYFPLDAIDTSSASMHEQTTYAAGVRYDLQPGFSLKAQVDHITDFNNTYGFFDSTSVTEKPDHSNMFSFSMNAAF